MTTRTSATDRVYATLREAIITGELAGGSQHSIYRLAEHLGVSRTPVRDAVLRLADAGMLSIERNRGVRIRGLSVNDIREVFEARLLLEVPATAFAAAAPTAALLEELDARLLDLTQASEAHDEAEFSRHDRELHRAILGASGNARLAALVDSLRDTTQAQGVSTVDQSRSLREVRSEHLPIVDAIRARDPEAAAAQMRAHLITTAMLLMQQVASVTGETVPQDWPTTLTDAP